MTSHIKVIHGDCVDVLPDITGVDLVSTSPPYHLQRTYDGTVTEGTPFNFYDVADAIYTSLKPNGILCWNENDSVVNGSKQMIPERHAMYFTDNLRMILVTKIIWNKSFPKSYGNRKPLEVYEPIYVFAKGKDYIYNPIHDRRNKEPGAVRRAHRRDTDGNIERGNINPPTPEFGARSDIWSTKTGKYHTRKDGNFELIHPAMQGIDIAIDIVKSWSNPDDLVVDPMCGSGTTLLAAIKTGRNSIGIDRVERYVEMARERTAQRSLI